MVCYLTRHNDLLCNRLLDARLQYLVRLFLESLADHCKSVCRRLAEGRVRDSTLAHRVIFVILLISLLFVTICTLLGPTVAGTLQEQVILLRLDDVSLVSLAELAAD